MYKNPDDQKAAARRHYLRNKEKIIQRAKAFTKKARIKVRAYIQSVKENSSCNICGISDHRVLDFHHLSEKIISIGSISQKNWNLGKLKKEIKKCILLCSNCHRILHYDEKHSSGVEQSGSSSAS